MKKNFPKTFKQPFLKPKLFIVAVDASYGGKNTAFALFTRVHKGGKLMVWPLFKKIELWKTSFLEALNQTHHTQSLRMKEKSMEGHPKLMLVKYKKNPKILLI